MKKLIILIVFVIAITSALFVFKLGKIAVFATRPADSQSIEKKTILIPRGRGAQSISSELQNQNVVSDGALFLKLGRYLKSWNKLKAGEYEISADMTPLQIFDVLTSGISVVHPFTIKEGDNLYQVGELLELKKLGLKSKFTSLCFNPEFIQGLKISTQSLPSLEGFLFPETYHLTRTMTEEEIIRVMVMKHRSLWTPERLASAAKLKMTPYEVLTLASIVEKETGAPEERPLISSIFHNRLRKGMKLQSDPTTIYGIWNRYKGNIHRQDLLEKNNYNTYAISALPVGPISNPGIEAIDATLHPVASDYLFFVSKNDGTHEFSATLKQHNEAVRKFQLNRAAREGKSWRDLKKKAGSR